MPSAYGPLPAMSIDRIGYGAGDRDFVGLPNVLRVYVGRDRRTAGSEERVTVMQCEIDDMNPQLYGVLMERLLAAGALDVFLRVGTDEEEPARHAGDGAGAAGPARRR